MKFLFVIQGEGRGHLTQAIALKNILEKHGHEVAEVLIGKSSGRRIPKFVEKKLNTPIGQFESPNFVPSKDQKRVSLVKSVVYNAVKTPMYLKSIHYIHKKIKAHNPDAVINFFDLLTGVLYHLNPLINTKLICIAHQYLMLHQDFEFPTNKTTEIESLLYYTRFTAKRANRLLALSFSKYTPHKKNRIVTVPPLLRTEVLAQKPGNEDFILGYILNSAFESEVREWHEHHKEVKMEFFWDKKGAKKTTKIDDTLTFHLLDDKLFIEKMAQCKGYATTAGFESVCEAMYLGKPALLIPAHIEQECNAIDAEKAGAGVSADNFDMTKLLDFIALYSPNQEFGNWVSQAETIIIKEIEEVCRKREEKKQ